MAILLKRFNEEVDTHSNMSDENILRMLSTLIKLEEIEPSNIGYIEHHNSIIRRFKRSNSKGDLTPSKTYYADLITDWGKVGFDVEDTESFEPAGIDEWYGIEILTRDFEKSKYQLTVRARFSGSDYDDLKFQDFEDIISLKKIK